MTFAWNITWIKCLKPFNFFIFNRYVNGIHWLNFCCQAFFCLFHFRIKIYCSYSIKLRGSNKAWGIRYFIFSLCGFRIQICFGRQISNIRCFTFNHCSLCFQSSLCSKISDIRYFVFNLCGFCIESSSSN